MTTKNILEAWKLNSQFKMSLISSSIHRVDSVISILLDSNFAEYQRSSLLYHIEQNSEKFWIFHGILLFSFTSIPANMESNSYNCDWLPSHTDNAPNVGTERS